MSKLIFLDIDGVLNNCDTPTIPETFTIGIDLNLVNKLKTVVESCNAEIILVSSWKGMWLSNSEEGIYLDRQFGLCDIYISGTTKEGWSHRGEYIKKYIEERKNVEAFVIIDDETFDYEEQGLMEHLVQTDTSTGITDADVLTAIEILGG